MDDTASLLKERRKPEHRQQIIDENLVLVKKMIADSVSRDTFIIQSISTIDDLDKLCNLLTKRVREWYGYYFPELSWHIEDNEIYIRKILLKSKNEYMQEFSLYQSMGPKLEEKDLEAIIGLVRSVEQLYSERENIIHYLKELMQEHCRNVYTIVGALIGAKLLQKAGSLKHLSQMPSSTIQVLGAESALFRHLRNKKIRPPKHGLILSHPLVMNARRDERGKRSRQLAAKISIAAKVDYFKGEFIGDKLKEDLERQR